MASRFQQQQQQQQPQQPSEASRFERVFYAQAVPARARARARQTRLCRKRKGPGGFRRDGETGAVTARLMGALKLPTRECWRPLNAARYVTPNVAFVLVVRLFSPGKRPAGAVVSAVL